MSYRALAGKQTLLWSFTVAAGRLPVAMAPLAFIFLAKEASGDYARGAVLAAGYTVAEAVGAPFLGARLRNRPHRREIAIGLLTSAVFFAGLAALPDAPLGASVIMAAAAGGAGAAVPGALRAMVADLVPAKDLNSALSWESSLNMAVWAASPALVASAATWWSATIPFYASAASATAAAACIFALPERTGRSHTDVPLKAVARRLTAAWPIYLTSAAAMYLLATVELSLPALLEHRELPAAASGPLLTGFALASIVGGLVYGLRNWPGSPERHSTIFLPATIAAAASAAAVPVLGGLAVVLLAAGLFQAVVLIARNLSLQRALPSDLHAVGYSLQYAGSGVGYGLSAGATGVLLNWTNPTTTILITAGVTLLLTAGSALGKPHPMVREPERVSHGPSHGL
ncbi:MFS transporter [Streptomyces sp. B93]|uniref:MFS transporter n=1 Tax=Streptomyces sp. B93 TaxID=2824875 RepID=UPI001B393736|nr:MFS transporter [Streptomyces sp. B93]MBQ1094448.1 MFS transporter [Streptomyces sp. B93]